MGQGHEASGLEVQWESEAAGERCLVKGEKGDVVAIPMNGAEKQPTGRGENLLEWERLSEETFTPSDDTC